MEVEIFQWDTGCSPVASPNRPLLGAFLKPPGVPVIADFRGERLPVSVYSDVGGEWKRERAPMPDYMTINEFFLK
ncbi:MAG: hypothetical protein ACYS47_04640, partial [Planctomycetota bacterium]